MAYSLTWLFVTLFIILVLVILSTAICFIAPGYLLTPTSASQTQITNDNSARYFLYIAGGIGVLIFILLIVAIFISYRYPDENDVQAMLNAYFGWGTFFLMLVLFFLTIIMIFMIIYSVSFIDLTNQSGNNARWWSIIAAVLMGVALILLFVAFYFYYAFNRYITSIIGEATPGELDSTDKSLDDVFFFHRNSAKPGIFEGTISLKGKLARPNQVIYYKGKKIENLRGDDYENVDVSYNLSDAPVADKIVEEKKTATTTTVPKGILRSETPEERVARRNMLQNDFLNKPVKRVTVNG